MEILYRAHLKEKQNFLNIKKWHENADIFGFYINHPVYDNLKIINDFNYIDDKPLDIYITDELFSYLQKNDSTMIDNEEYKLIEYKESFEKHQKVIDIFLTKTNDPKDITIILEDLKEINKEIKIFSLKLKNYYEKKIERINEAHLHEKKCNKETVFRLKDNLYSYEKTQTFDAMVKKVANTILFPITSFVVGLIIGIILF